MPRRSRVGFRNTRMTSPININITIVIIQLSGTYHTTANFTARWQHSAYCVLTSQRNDYYMSHMYLVPTTKSVATVTEHYDLRYNRKYSW